LRARETGVPSALARRKTTAPEATGCASSTFFSLKEQRNVKQQPYGRSTETKNARTRPKGNKQTNGGPQLDLTLKSNNNHPVRLAYQPPTVLLSQNKPASSTFLSKQISTSKTNILKAKGSQGPLVPALRGGGRACFSRSNDQPNKNVQAFSSQLSDLFYDHTVTKQPTK
jgi:hypothetical protein